jgi:leucyl-tRNA synthetase
MNKSTAKLDNQKAIEATINLTYGHNDDNNYDFNNPKKKFITFPFAYQNGRLHAGHISTFLKCDILANYYKLQGYNVLLPFGFHATGSPIVACANKLAKELATVNVATIDPKSLNPDSQIKILLSMNVPRDMLPEFVDPLKWITYFPEINTADLKKLGTSINFTRSFVTTDHNPHFSAFVRWQFKKLEDNGNIIFGSKLVICTFNDDKLQVCSAHDRIDGDEAKPQLCYLGNWNIDGCVLLYCVSEKNNNESIVLNGEFVTTQCNNNDTIYLVPKIHYNAIKYQFEQFHSLEILSTSFTFPKNVTNNCSTYLDFYIPSEPVVSREGNIGFVALVDQYFINYADGDWKNNVSQLTSDVNCYNQNAKNKLIDGVNNLHEWAVTRAAETTIGTKFLNTNFVIDSLSDSTIYMAYYTISDKITRVPNDLFKDDKVSREMFEYIFGNGLLSNQVLIEYQKLLNDCKKEYNYWYPVDIRISGIDLISNHLSMALYNHYAVLGPKSLPKSYYINGHLLLDGKKMSKSKGIFILLSEMIDNYGADATRFALIKGLVTTENSLDNSNFTKSNADNAIIAIDAERSNMLSLINSLVLNEDTELNFIDNAFASTMQLIKNSVIQAYENLDFQNVLKLAFIDLTHCKNDYIKSGITPNQNLLKKFVDLHTILLHPCIPYYAKYLWQHMQSKGMPVVKSLVEIPDLTIHYSCIFVYNKLQNYISNICKELTKLQKRQNKFKNVCDPKNLTLTLTIFNYNEEQLSIIDNTNSSELTGTQLKFKSYVNSVVKVYGSIMKDIDETSYLMQWLQTLYLAKANKQFCIKNFIIKNGESRDINCYPWNGSIMIN